MKPKSSPFTLCKYTQTDSVFVGNDFVEFMIASRRGWDLCTLPKQQTRETLREVGDAVHISYNGNENGFNIQDMIQWKVLDIYLGEY
jgi:hypothetical protein